MIQALQEQYSNKTLTPSDVVERMLKDIDLLNPHLRIYTYVAYKEAREQAREQTEYLKKGGKVADRGVLFGIPVCVKDLEHVAGMPTSYGSLLFKDLIAVQDSIPVKRLREAGAIFMGKTCSPIFGSKAYSKNRIDGIIRNPWDLTRSTGGSSSGAGSAIACDLAILATGSDAGGSVRGPAAFCGCFGIKPTFGFIPLSFGLPSPNGSASMEQFTNLAHHGPLTRCVIDSAIYMDVTCGYHHSDPLSLPKPTFSFAKTVLDDAKLKRNQNLRVCYCVDIGYGMKDFIDPVIEAQFRKAVKDFAVACGLKTQPVEIKGLDLPDVGNDWNGFVAAQDYGKYNDHPLITGKEDLLERAFVDGYKNAPKSFNLDLLVRINKKKAQLNSKLGRLFEQYDVMITPALPTTAWSFEKPMPRVDMTVVGYSTPFNFSGLPAASIRCGLHDEDGLPVAIQIVCDRHNDATVLSCAYAYEQYTRCNTVWPTKESIIAKSKKLNTNKSKL